MQGGGGQQPAKVRGSGGQGQGVEREELISWLTDGRYPDAVFDHIMVMAPDGYEVSQSTTHKTDRSVSDHRAVIIELAGLPDLGLPLSLFRTHRQSQTTPHPVSSP